MGINWLQKTVCCECGVFPGDYHKPGCEIEMCPYCGASLADCIEEGCREEAVNTIWPPVLDDRIPWSGLLPGIEECKDFGWFGRSTPEKGYEQCAPHDEGAMPQLIRLGVQTEWSRNEKRCVRTNLLVAFSDLGKKGIIVEAGLFASRKLTLASIADEAADRVDTKYRVNGYAFYTFEDDLRKRAGIDFELRFGQVKHPELGRIGMKSKEVGRLIHDSLIRNNIKCQWSGSARDPIIIDPHSIVALTPDLVCAEM